MSDNIKEISPLISKVKSNTPAIMIGDKVFVGGIGGDFVPKHTDLSETTAVVSDVLAGKYFYNASGEKVQGTIQTVSQPDPTVSISDNGTITASHTSTTGYVVSSATKTATASLSIDASKILAGKTVYGVSGTATSDANATADKIVSGYSAYVNGSKINGNISTVSQPNPEVSIDSDTGLITAYYTPVSGFVEESPEKSRTLQLTVQGSQTFTPTTTDQTISAGKFLVGVQTIKGDSNLTADNIAKDVVIFGITGTHEGGTSAVAGYYKNTNGTITFQPIGGSEESVSKIYIPNTGVAEPQYNDSSSSGSSAIYKCASVDTTAKTWTGYLYDSTTQSIASTTTSLTYSSVVAPTVGNYYTEDGLIEVNPYVQNGLVLYAPLRSSQSMADTGQTATEHNNPVFSTDSGVACLDKTSNNNGYVTFSNNNTLPTTRPLSISAFLKWTPVSGDITVIYYGTYDDSVNQSVHAIVVHDTYYGLSDNHQYAIFDTASKSDWTHVVGTWDASNLEKLYINGVLIGSVQAEDSTINSDFNIGLNWEQSSAWTGKIAEVKMWNRALTQAEIAVEYNRLQSLVTE